MSWQLHVIQTLVVVIAVASVPVLGSALGRIIRYYGRSRHAYRSP